MRLIDADSLKKNLSKWLKQVDPTHPSDIPPMDDIIVSTIMTIEEEPTVEAEPVRHGHWIMEFENDDGRSLRCSNCRMVFWVGHGRDGNYCPNCGSKMDERKEK